MKLWKANQPNATLMFSSKQWTPAQPSCLPGSYLLTQMTATEKCHWRAWHPSLAAVRAEWPQVLLPTMKPSREWEGKWEHKCYQQNGEYRADIKTLQLPAQRHRRLLAVFTFTLWHGNDYHIGNLNLSRMCLQCRQVSTCQRCLKLRVEGGM